MKIHIKVHIYEQRSCITIDGEGDGLALPSGLTKLILFDIVIFTVKKYVTIIPVSARALWLGQTIKCLVIKWPHDFVYLLKTGQYMMYKIVFTQ